MVLTTGTILGSTNKRIQIANENNELPQGTSTDALVLQGRYVQLLDDKNEQIYGTRGYVQSYDATFGHIYPAADSFSVDNIDTASRVAFYKYTNDPELILAGDRVRAASEKNVTGLFDRYPSYSVDSWCADKSKIDAPAEGSNT